MIKKIIGYGILFLIVSLLFVIIAIAESITFALVTFFGTIIFTTIIVYAVNLTVD